ncbi:Similar to mRNA 3' acc. no. Q4IPA4 [Pyronema omphalodes CBS 100304]|uniref:Similar to mRNA 3&apos acc. no. Q4IPA4 n=1 Tax=Pyronema omphalodes (strain CBS 100304) TaxID=1076935 RepID=U4L3K3_PYROM|nr:Similar to mRNA 3' acc. no. Q4IPA4 [Pyronema omphalodes CBS 100304]
MEEAPSYSPSDSPQAVPLPDSPAISNSSSPPAVDFLGPLDSDDDVDIEVDPALEDDFSDYESSGYDVSTASLSASIQEYVYENGRRYHRYFGADRNLMPTDEVEQDRLDVHHEAMTMILGGNLHKAPLDHPQRILDVGTGTGIWCVDMADTYPMAEVIGTDLSPIQPMWVPPNCKFEVDDAELDWTFNEDYFDFIHMRNLAQSVSNWSHLISSAFRCVKPGGYLELVELGQITYSDDDSMKDDNPIKIHFETTKKAMEKIGRPPQDTENMKRKLEEAGFIDVKVMRAKQPIGPWPKDKGLKRTGAMVLLACDTGFHAYGMAAFTRILGMSTEEADRVCREAVAACRNKNYHIYNYMHVAYGRKPENA